MHFFGCDLDTWPALWSCMSHVCPSAVDGEHVYDSPLAWNSWVLSVNHPAKPILYRRVLSIEELCFVSLAAWLIPDGRLSAGPHPPPSPWSELLAEPGWYCKHCSNCCCADGWVALCSPVKPNESIVRGRERARQGKARVPGDARTSRTQPGDLWTRGTQLISSTAPTCGKEKAGSWRWSSPRQTTGRQAERFLQAIAHIHCHSVIVETCTRNPTVARCCQLLVLFLPLWMLDYDQGIMWMGLWHMPQTQQLLWNGVSAMNVMCNDCTGNEITGNVGEQNDSRHSMALRTLYSSSV